MMTGLIELIVFITILVFISSFLSLCEVALLSCNNLKLSLLVDQHPNLKALNNNKNYIASTVMILNNVVDIVGITYGGSLAYQLYGDTIEYTAYTVGVTCALLYLATLFPKLYAASHADIVLRYMGLVLIVIYWLFRPVIAILYFPIRLFIKEGVENGLSQAELDSVIGLAQNKNLLNDKQSTIISNIIGLKALKISDIIPSKSKIDSVDLESTVADCEAVVMNGHHKRYVVTKKHRSNNDDKVKHYPVGIVLYQDIVQTWLCDKKETRISSLMHPVMTTEDSESAMDLLEKLNHSVDHISVITHKNGTIKGVLQSDDIINALLQNRIDVVSLVGS
jgi:CBS domain containing-hemolysin-like protein